MAEKPTSKDDVVVSAKLPADTVEALDQWAEQAGLSRSEAIRQLVEAGLLRFKDYAPFGERS